MSAQLTIRDMLKAGVHFGHKTRFWNPKMKPYIFGEHQKIHVINLEKTLPLFQEALNFIGRIVAKKGKVLIVGTKRSARVVVAEESTRAGMPYVNHRWLGGMLTNYKTVRQSIKRLKDFEKMQDEGMFARLTKKEAMKKERELFKLQRSLGGIKEMSGLPDALFVIDSTQESIAIQEANRLGIPVIAVVDTNASPDGIDYLIPGNDDAMRSIALFMKFVADTVIDAKGVHPDLATLKINSDDAHFEKKAKPARKAEVETESHEASESSFGMDLDALDTEEAVVVAKPAAKAKASAESAVAPKKAAAPKAKEVAVKPKAEKEEAPKKAAAKKTKA